jgi:CheY-like chemotaxis protein
MQGKVAIFDDDHDILELCSFILQQKGFEVLTRPDCRDLVETVSNFQPDVILMDNWIPESGGIEATQTLKAEPLLQKIPIIYFSANNDIKSLAAKAGADKFLAKPFDIDALEKLVADTIKESRN